MRKRYSVELALEKENGKTITSSGGNYDNILTAKSAAKRYFRNGTYRYNIISTVVLNNYNDDIPDVVYLVDGTGSCDVEPNTYFRVDWLESYDIDMGD